MPKGQGGEEFAGCTGTDGGVVLEGHDFLEDGGVAAGQPAEAQAGKAVGLADGGETQSAVIEVAGGGKTHGRIMLELAVNLVGENVNVVARSEIEDATENFRRHEEARGVVGRIDVDGAGVGANQRFERGEIVGPGVFGLSAPYANGGAGAFGQGERAFIAGRFNDGVIVGSEKGVVEEEDGFFGGGNNDEITGIDLLVDGGEDFAQPQSTR